MNNKLLPTFYLLGCLLLYSFSLPKNGDIEGAWILSSVDAVGMTTVESRQTAIGNNEPSPDIEENNAISLKEHVEQNLYVGKCKFVFHGEQYEFYRKGETISHQGAWSVQGDSLVLTRASSHTPVIAKIVSVEQQVLQLEISFDSKPVTLLFIKKQ